MEVDKFKDKARTLIVCGVTLGLANAGQDIYRSFEASPGPTAAYQDAAAEERLRGLDAWEQTSAGRAFVASDPNAHAYMVYNLTHPANLGASTPVKFGLDLFLVLFGIFGLRTGQVWSGKRRSIFQLVVPGKAGPRTIPF